MPKFGPTFLTLYVAFLAGLYQLHLRPIFSYIALFERNLPALNNEHCTLVPELQACEKIVLHQPTGVVYAACSTLRSRLEWTPGLHHLNATARSRSDYIATYDPATGKVQRLTLAGFDEPRGYNSHGLDVVQSTANAHELWVYAVNQRPPHDETTAEKAFSDPSVEVFRTTVGSKTLTHIRTFEDKNAILSPNDLVGSPDGKSFWFTNDGTHVRTLSFLRPQLFLGQRYGSVGYCHSEHGCKIAADGLSAPNGITRGPAEGTLMVASTTRPELVVLETQADGSAVLTDVIALTNGSDMAIDNLSTDTEGAVWGAGFPEMAKTIAHFIEPSIPSAVTALRIAINTGHSAFFGEKYSVEQVFNDDGSIVSGSTTVVHDAERGRLIFGGLLSPGLSVCKYKKKTT